MAQQYRTDFVSLVPGKKLFTVCRKKVIELQQSSSGDAESPRSVEDQSVKDEWDAVTTSISALLTSVGESPVDKRRIGNKRYAEGKLKMIEQNVRKKLKLEPSKDDFQEVLEQLKRKFNGCAKKSEKLQVLTILPQSWSIKRIEMEFGTTNHMARLAKALVASKGILATPNPRPGKTLSDDTVQLVKLFYLNDSQPCHAWEKRLCLHCGGW